METKGELPMSAENKTLARRIREGIWNGKGLSGVDQVIAVSCERP